jgi:hypothetical protein
MFSQCAYFTYFQRRIWPKKEQAAMTKEKFSAMLWLIIPQVIQLWVDNRRVSSHEAVILLYDSELYAMLEKEESKLWHLSAATLYGLLDEELTTGNITFPEEA